MEVRLLVWATFFYMYATNEKIFCRILKYFVALSHRQNTLSVYVVILHRQITNDVI